MGIGNKTITKDEEQMIMEKYNFYCSFNFPEIALNRLSWDFGHDVDVLKSVIEKQQMEDKKP